MQLAHGNGFSKFRCISGKFVVSIVIVASPKTCKRPVIVERHGDLDIWNSGHGPTSDHPPFKFQFPVSAGSVRGPVIPIMTAMAAVGTGLGAVVAGVGTGAGVVEHPAARMPINKTAQTKNSKDFIAQNIMIFY